MNTNTNTNTTNTTNSAAQFISRRVRLLTGTAAVVVTFGLFQSVALYGKPASTETMAQAKPAVAVTVASAR